MSTTSSDNEYQSADSPRKCITKHPFTPHEDQILIRFIMMNGPQNWSTLASLLYNRTPKQCRERWHNHLDPKINKGPWTYSEDCIIAEKQRELGNKWADIARFLPGRTDTLVKNRWNTSVKARCNELLRKNTPCMQTQFDESFNNFLSSLQLPRKFDVSFTQIPPLMQRPSAQTVLFGHPN
ncbi:Myb-like DNA-binding domain containing protein [Trichomonas vaginalis G3]|uniref:Myb-like DNA-binding domain containing protein n=1 Tax=Trichomonas vaginalis (strain ATCC PRA-98 / G3) TaxID=412133 RepID=A2FDL3_TRIV3|nr:RNA polymerase II transcription regulator recruiting protein [Trichomonas vaginalis G3]EAX96994.1 Myb-like DNA-binding domain containing protein [Trichomonas vaginalis G3]KAI5487313.1 RNA polymerase II transcription regulator recruiting protein [Trichomonas vaginalis G3]|eukprot:XP_001309924.1 Myb-like DNA-binding domain containing protein [Trichomonas vaginalis G3]